MATEAGTGAADAPVINPLAMSDEDIMKAGIPENLEAVLAKPEGEQAGEGAAAPEGEQANTQAAGETAGKEGGVEAPAPAEGAAKDATGKEGEAKPEAEKPATEGAAAAAGSETDKTAGEAGEQSSEETPPDYENFYKKVMKPFVANGKTIELRSPDEAVQLMQMGANYTRKMQELAPHRKMLTMLQNNNLLDENKLSFLIDLDKKNPEAIKKLIKDSGVDPLEIDTTAEPAYQEGSHRVSDEEVNFRSALGELSSTQDGRDTLQVINTRWDQSSKDLLWKHPQTMAMIDAQRQVGIYDRIVDEIDRRITLGSLSAQTPFLEAYKVVGDEFTTNNGFADLIEKHQGTASSAQSASPGQGTSEVKPEPVATRVVAPKPQVSNGEQASAASATRTSTKQAQPFVNPLAMSDEDFMKSFGQFQGRL